MKSIKDLWPIRELSERQKEKRLLQISYYRGEMIIALERLFPCEQARLKGILKLVNEDCDHRDTSIQQMTIFCDASIQQMEDIISEKANLYVDLRTEAAEILPEVEKAENRVEYLHKVHASKAEIKMAQERAKAFSQAYREVAANATHCKADIKRCQTMLEKMQKNTEVINKWKR